MNLVNKQTVVGFVSSQKFMSHEMFKFPLHISFYMLIRKELKKETRCQKYLSQKPFVVLGCSLSFCDFWTVCLHLLHLYLSVVCYCSLSPHFKKITFCYLPMSVKLTHHVQHWSYVIYTELLYCLRGKKVTSPD